MAQDGVNNVAPLDIVPVQDRQPFEVRGEDQSLFSTHYSLGEALTSIAAIRPSVNQVLRCEVWDCVRPNHPRVVAVVDSEGSTVDLPAPLWYNMR